MDLSVHKEKVRNLYKSIGMQFVSKAMPAELKASVDSLMPWFEQMISAAEGDQKEQLSAIVAYLSEMASGSMPSEAKSESKTETPTQKSEYNAKAEIDALKTMFEKSLEEIKRKMDLPNNATVAQGVKPTPEGPELSLVQKSLEAVTKSMGELVTKFDAIEKMRGASTSVQTQTEQKPVTKSFWSGTAIGG